MALRTGTYLGPAKTVDYLGIAGGLLAPVLIALYVIVGGLWVNHDARYADQLRAAEDLSSQLTSARLAGADLVPLDRDSVDAAVTALEEGGHFQAVGDALGRALLGDSEGETDHDHGALNTALGTRELGDLLEMTERVQDVAVYSHIDDTMSELGDRNDALGIWFLVVNAVVGVLLILFTWAVFRRLPVGRWVVLLLAAAAVLSAVLGLTRCQWSCDLTGRRLRDDLAHDVTGFVLLLLIVLIPALASLDLPRPNQNGQSQLFSIPDWMLRTARVVPQLAVIPAAATILTAPLHRYVGLLERITFGIGYGFIIASSLLMWSARRGFDSPPFDVTRVQENVLYGSRDRTYGRVVLGRIEDGGQKLFRQALAKALKDGLIRSEARRPRPALSPRRDFTITLGFTALGLKTLGVPYRWKAQLPDAFGEGMHARRARFGDPEYEKHWADRPHLVFYIAAASEPLAKEQFGAIETLFKNSVTLHELPAGKIGPDTDLLRFSDGLSNPWLVDVHRPDDDARRGGGKLNADLEWEQLALGEFILGEFDESRDVFPVPEPRSVFEAGTFLVLRQLEVDAKQFGDILTAGRAALVATGETDEATMEDLVALKMMGRNYDGLPAAESIDGSSGFANNNFSYGNDPEGFHCPLGAHVRRANPRDSLGFNGVPAHRRRLIRRGMPYEIPEGDRTQGLHFAAFNARITDQFEFIQERWLNDGDAFRLGHSPDPIAGQYDTTRHFTWQRSNGPIRLELDPSKPITTTLGGAYFLVPAMAGLRALAREDQ